MIPDNKKGGSLSNTNNSFLLHDLSYSKTKSSWLWCSINNKSLGDNHQAAHFFCLSSLDRKITFVHNCLCSTSIPSGSVQISSTKDLLSLNVLPFKRNIITSNLLNVYFQSALFVVAYSHHGIKFNPIEATFFTRRSSGASWKITKGTVVTFATIVILASTIRCKSNVQYDAFRGSKKDT